jgi:hypothetical protein
VRLYKVCMHMCVCVCVCVFMACLFVACSVLGVRGIVMAEVAGRVRPYHVCESASRGYVSDQASQFFNPVRSQESGSC